MGQSSSSDTGGPGPVYVPVYCRPKWPDQDWYISVDVIPAGAPTSTFGYCRSEMDDFTQKLQADSEKKDVDAYVRQRLRSLIGSMKSNIDAQQKDKTSPEMGRLRRTLSYLRGRRGSRSDDTRSNQRASKEDLTRSRSHDVTPLRPLLEDEGHQRTTVHQFDLTPDNRPLEPMTDKNRDYRNQLIRLANGLKLSDEDDSTSRVCEEVKRTVDDAQWYLRRAYKAFKDAEIISAGSIADGTKIISANEFDFVVLLPCLEESVKEIKVLEDIENEYIRLKLVQENKVIGNGNVVSNISGESSENLIKMVLDAFKSFLRPGWMLVSTESKSFVTRVHLEHEAPQGKETVRFDISLAVPVNSNKVVKVDVNNPEEVVKLPLWNFLMGCLEKYEAKIFALIHYQSRDASRRISLSLAEKELMFKYGESNGAVECLTLCKILVAFFFPLILDENSWEAFVPPYLLKNAIFFLMAHHNAREKWEGEEMFLRVVEVFKLLGKSLGEESFGSRGSRIALFVFPGFIVFPEFSNDSCRFNPKELLMRDSMTHSFHEGQIIYRCEFPLAEPLSGFLEATGENGVCGKYVQKLRNTDWNFRELLKDFISVLDDLFDYKATVPWFVDEKNNNSS